MLKPYHTLKVVIVDYPLEIQRKVKPEGSNLPLTLELAQCLVLTSLLFGLVGREKNMGLGGTSLEFAWDGGAPACLQVSSDHDGQSCRGFFLPQSCPCERLGPL